MAIEPRWTVEVSSGQYTQVGAAGLRVQCGPSALEAGALLFRGKPCALDAVSARAQGFDSLAEHLDNINRHDAAQPDFGSLVKEPEPDEDDDVPEDDEDGGEP